MAFSDHDSTLSLTIRLTASARFGYLTSLFLVIPGHAEGRSYVLISIPPRLRRSLRFDTGFAHLRASVVATATVLGSYGMALVVEHFARLRVDTVIQAVVIASAFARAQRSSDWTDRLLGVWCCRSRRPARPS